jgi:NAD(P)-dependent dehydrogenase (short-subunit alcohol dehydrogenase family)
MSSPGTVSASSPGTVSASLPSLFRLDGRVALVTGASSGLGLRFARVLHEAGATVVAAARRLDRLEALTSELERATAEQCDVGDPQQIDRLLGHVLDRHGNLDIVVNNAGTTDVADFPVAPDDDFARVLGINLVAPYLISKRAAEAMLAAKRPGAIVNVASIFGLRASHAAGPPAYAASKGGVVSLTQALAARWARRGIRVNALAPGWFGSEMTQEVFDNDAALNWVTKRTPMARVGREEELDGPILFLASEASGYMTGQTLVIDGGWCAV